MAKQLTIIQAENGFIVRPAGKTLVFPTLKDLQKFEDEFFAESPQSETSKKKPDALP